MTLGSCAISGLNPHVFEVAIKTERCRAGGRRYAASATRRSRVVGGRDCRSRRREFPSPSTTVGCALLRPRLMPAASSTVSGGYDIPADQADIRAACRFGRERPRCYHPEIQLFAAGSPDKLSRTIDVSALSSWLAVRAIDRETRRPRFARARRAAQAGPASIPPPALAHPLPGGPATATQDPRRIPLKPSGIRAAPVAPAAARPIVGRQMAPLPLPGGASSRARYTAAAEATDGIDAARRSSAVGAKGANQVLRPALNLRSPIVAMERNLNRPSNELARGSASKGVGRCCAS